MGSTKDILRFSLLVPLIACAVAMSACDEPTAAPEELPSTPPAASPPVVPPPPGYPPAGETPSEPGQLVVWNPDGSVLRVPTPSGFDDIFPAAINAAGHVTGSYLLSGSYRAFFWSAQTGFVDIGGSTSSEITAVDINDDGVVAGTVWTSRRGKAFTWTQSGGMRVIDDQPSSNVIVDAINRFGHIAGTRNGRPFVWSQEGGFITDRSSDEHANESMGLWRFGISLNDSDEMLTTWMGRYDPRIDYAFGVDPEPGVVTRAGIRSLGCALCVVSGMNNHLQVVGIQLEGLRAFVWSQATGMRLLPVYDGTSSEAAAINNQGMIAGSLRYWAGDTRSRAVVWSGSNIILMDALPGTRLTIARDINDRGQVLVYAR